MIGFATIPQGQRALIWDRSGAARRVDGPRRLFLLGQRIERLVQHAAGPDEYLAVECRDGRRETVKGPAFLWFDPVEHRSIRVEKAVAVDANEALVVYRQEAGGVERRVVRGPLLFVPAANEWLHEFSWHGADPKDPRRKMPSALKFKKLRVIPDQTYYDVEDVRTADDALLVVKLMLFFELTDIERMLGQTHDAIADFINAASADVIDFAAARSFDRFKAETEQLNTLAAFPQLVQRGERIGYRINKVVYRGYHASGTLQTMHDDAIEARTKLRLEAETEAQAQELEDMRLQRETARALQRRQNEEGEARHRIGLRRLEHLDRLRRREESQKQALESRRASDLQKQAQFQALRGLDVDLTNYLVARFRNPDRVIRVDGGGKPHLHLND